MKWDRDGKSWPNNTHSRFLRAGGVLWHLQEICEKDAPCLLLLHGSGATTHSFADIMPLLAQHFHVLAIDIPGHGFSSAILDQKPTLPNVGKAISDILSELNFNPDILVGHSAGAAIACELAINQGVKTKAIISINGAFYPFPGFNKTLFPAIARLLFLNPFVPSFLSFSAQNRQLVERIMKGTGSKLSLEQTEFYRRAFQSSDHVDGTLAMMAHWNLDPMAEMLKQLELPLLQIIGERDSIIEPSASLKTAKFLQNGERTLVPETGHLVHEEKPEQVATLIEQFFNKVASSS